MSNTKFSGLSPAASVAGGDAIPIVQGGVNAKATASQLPIATMSLTRGITSRTLAAYIRESIISVLDYGAVGDSNSHPLSDSFATLAAAQAVYPRATSLAQEIDACAIQLAIDSGAKNVFIPAGGYRIDKTISAKSGQRVFGVGYDSILLGHISAYPHITTTTTAASDSDVAGQRGGACFSDDLTPADSLSFAVFEGLHLAGFRYGFCPSAGSWNRPRWKDIVFENCNIGVFIYFACQNPILDGVSGIGAGGCTVFVGAATCFTTNNPYHGGDNFYCDGLEYRSHPQWSTSSADNPSFDAWFSASILRPGTVSNTALGNKDWSDGVYAGTVLKPSGRAVYIPSRNGRYIFSPRITHCETQSNPRGAVLIGCPLGAEIGFVSGELDFNPGGLTENFVVILLSVVAATTGTIHDVNSEDDTTAGGAISFVAPSGAVAGRFAMANIKGIISGGEQHAYAIAPQISTAATGYDQWTKIMGLKTRPKGASGAGFGGNSSTWIKFAQGDALRLENFDNRSIRKHIASGLLAPPADTARVAQKFFIDSGSDGEAGGSPIYGTLDAYVRRWDTGDFDFSRYQVSVATRFNGSRTLTATGNIGDTTITVSSTTWLSPGTKITIGGTDKYLVKSVSGGVVTLASALRNTYANGSAISAASSLDRTITAWAQGSPWATIDFDTNDLRVTSALGTSIPVEFWLYLHGISPPAGTTP